jgi:hypothetical protein
MKSAARPLQFSLATTIAILATTAVQIAVLVRMGLPAPGRLVSLALLLALVYGSAAGVVLWIARRNPGPISGGGVAAVTGVHVLAGQGAFALLAGLWPLALIPWFLIDSLAFAFLLKRDAPVTDALTLVGATTLLLMALLVGFS